jgi:uncharacterized iron-regulated protein
MLGAGYAFEYYRRFREPQLQAAQLEAQLVQAQLQALKMQLHRHFLFNMLQAISALMEDDVRAARRMIARLSERLRLTLENAGRQEVLLSEELDALRRQALDGVQPEKGNETLYLLRDQAALPASFSSRSASAGICRSAGHRLARPARRQSAGR